MNRLDKDIELAKQQLSSVLSMARDGGISPTKFVKEHGFKIPLERRYSYSDMISFYMEPNYEKYGKDIVYYFDKWNAKLAILLGAYSDEDFRTTSHIGLRQRYLHNKNNTFVFLTWGARTGRIEGKNTSANDSWSGNSYNTLYGYSFKPSITFMNWDSNPLP